MTLFNTKKFHSAWYFLICLLMVSISCQDSNKSTTKDSQQISAPLAPSAASPAPSSQSATSSAAAQPGQRGITHYMCTNNCVGSGGPSAGNCPVCGTAYVHNDAYHTIDQDIQKMQQQGNPSQSVTPGNLKPSVFNSPQTQTTIRNQPPKTPEPAQNAAGVWHYTCANGCAGGGGSAVACGTCGSTLAHNQAYHQ